MQEHEHTIVQFDLIRNMLGDDQEAISEFCNAAVTSFTTFRDEFTQAMNNKDMENLRKAGHRIKPAAQMVGVHVLIEKYEEAKKILEDSARDEAIDECIQNMHEICGKAIKDFHQQIQ